MFFIVNKTKGTITLGDLGISLGPRQAIDLDRIMKRGKSEGSRSLKDAKKNGAIEVRIKDDPISNKTSGEKSLYQGPDLGSMKNEIIGEMKDVMKELLKKQGAGVSKEDLQALIDAMPKSTETVIIRQEGEKIREDEEVEMDEEMLAKINARTVNEIVKDTEIKSVHYKEKHEDNTILGNADELMDLLG